MIKLVVFDMAGTTIDEQNVVYKTVQQAIQRAGFAVNLDLVLLHAAGKEKYQAIWDVLQELPGNPASAALAQAIFQDFEALLAQAYAQLKPLPMPGARMVFEELRRREIKIALNTGYQRAVALGLLDRLDWQVGREVDLLVTASDVPKSRPNPDMIWAAMSHFGIKNSQVVAKIGDSIVDIAEGQNAGCGLVAGITTGAQTRAQLQSANPTHLFDHLSELLPLC